NGVVAHHFDLCAKLHQVMDEVPGEAVVIVDDKDHGALFSEGRRNRIVYWPKPASLACTTASRAAANRAPALASHSRRSAAGSESATMPAPAWTCIIPSFTTAVRSTMQLSIDPSGEK